MEFDKLKELKLTSDEIGRFSNAFKDQKFREMLHEYAKEISDPENKRKYEDDITRLEQERGMDVNFIHPEPWRVLKTSVDGKQKCFINICSNESIGKPEYKVGMSNGKSGQYWSLPNSLAPGRPDRDSKGNKCMIYDIVFHPDTLHIAGNNRTFMDMIDDLAIQGIQEGFKVKLDKKNRKVLKMKYKGTPHPAVIRKPIPGYVETEKPADPDPLSFPYPDEQRPDKALTADPKDHSKVEAKPIQFNSDTVPNEGLTKPNYALKYREHIDLQDFRLSRDSSRSRRPKEIVLEVDLPLLSSAGELDLNVTEKNVLLLTKGYRLHVPLGYPVDYDEGTAKFNKLTKQLVITLPVVPLRQPPPGPPSVSVAGGVKEEGEDSDQAERSEDKSTALGRGDASDHRVSAAADGSGETDSGSDPAVSYLHAGCQPSSVLRDREVTDQPAGWDEEEQDQHPDPGREEEDQHPDQADTADAPKHHSQSAEEEDEEDEPLSLVSNMVAETAATASGSTVEPQPVSHHQAPGSTASRGDTGKRTEDPVGRTRGTKGETEDLGEEVGSPKKETVPEGETGRSGRDTDDKQTPSTAEVSRKAVHFCDDVAVEPAPREAELEEVDEDDLLSEQTFTQDRDRKQFVSAPVELREIKKDGQEVVIRDHATSAGFSLTNSLLYDLD